MKKYLIKDKTFRTYCWLVFDCKEQEAIDWWNKKVGSNWKTSGALGKTFINYKKPTCAIWIKKKTNYETLAHEILHLIRFWLQDFFSIDLNQETEETYTLLHSFYFSECSKLLKRKLINL